MHVRVVALELKPPPGSKNGLKNQLSQISAEQPPPPPSPPKISIGKFVDLASLCRAEIGWSVSMNASNKAHLFYLDLTTGSSFVHFFICLIPLIN
jgi:hypothetical protein